MWGGFLALSFPGPLAPCPSSTAGSLCLGSLLSPGVGSPYFCDHLYFVAWWNLHLGSTCLPGVGNFKTVVCLAGTQQPLCNPLSSLVFLFSFWKSYYWVVLLDWWSDFNIFSLPVSLLCLSYFLGDILSYSLQVFFDFLKINTIFNFKELFSVTWLFFFLKKASYYSQRMKQHEDITWRFWSIFL